MITRIATVAVYVDSQEEALKFWTEKVGFELRRSQPMGPQTSWIEVAPQGAQSCLVIYPKAMMPNWQQLKASIVFECQDIQATYGQMSSRGVNFTEAPNAMAWSTYAKFVDPDGNEFLLKG